MPLSRLENFLKNAAGNILYVDPTSFDASDAYDNQGNSLTRPFVSIQRALIEAARFSYQVGRNNDKIDRTTILVYPGIHYIDNRPGFSVETPDGQTATYKKRTAQKTWSSTTLNELSSSTNFNVLDPNNDLYKLNSVNGGVILPRGTSIIGMDLRKTKIRPLYVPDPQNDAVDRSSIFNVTGTCYFSQFSFFDADPTKVAYKDYTNTQYVPNFSHHKLTAFAYADGVNKVALGYNQTTLTDLDMYYFKVAKFYGDVTGRSIGDYPQTIDFEPATDEFRIVGAVQTNPLGISSIFAGNGVIPSNIITVTTKDYATGLPANHGLSVDSPVLISGVTVDPNSYNGSVTVREVVGLTTFTYASASTPVNPIPINVDSTALDIAAVVAESDSVNSASPYIFSCSLRSVYGLCGMWADGSKADGFKSMVVAQFTGVSLQKDDNAFVIYQNGTYYDNLTLAPNSSKRPLHTNSYSVYKPNYQNFHIRCSNNSFIQCVSVFAIGYAKHFLAESGGDMSITNSNSNFGAVALESTGFQNQSFDRDDTGYITHIIPPKELDANDTGITWLSLDGGLINSSANVDRLYLFANTDPVSIPQYQVSGYRIGARINDTLYLPNTVGTSQTVYTTPILMTVPSGIGTSSNKTYAVGRNAGINSISSDTFTLTSNHQLWNGESVRVFSDTGLVPDGLSLDTVYYAITGGFLGANQIKLASSLGDAQNSNPITGIANGGGVLSIVSSVSDKIPGDFGHPIQYDTTVNNWYVTGSASATTNTIYSQIVGLGITSKTSNTYVQRKVDNRSVEDKIYRIRYVIPKNYINARPPVPGFILEESKTVGVTSFSYTTSNLISPVNLRNEKVIVSATAGSISNNSQVITINTEVPHKFVVGDIIKVQNVASTNNPSVTGITSTYNGSYTVQSVPSSRSFTYSISGVSTNPGSFTNAVNLRTTTAQISALPVVSRQEYLNKFYIYKVNTVRKYVYGSTDGVYELILLSSNANIPSSVGYGLSTNYFNQDVRNLYPQIDRDNFNSDPVASITFGDIQKIGKVVTDDKRKSITKETLDLITKNTRIGFGITGVSLSGTGNTTITLYTDVEHKLNSIKSLTVPTTGSGYAISSSYYSQDLIDASADENATCRFTTDGTGKIQPSSLQVVDPGSAYTVGTALSISGGLTITSVLGITTVSEINNNINDGLEISGFSQLALNGIHRILSVPNSKTVVIQHGTGISTYTPNTNGSIPTAYVASKGVGITSFAFPDTTTGIVTVTTSSPHGLLVGNKFTVYASGSNILNGTYIVRSVVGLSTFNYNIGIVTTTASSTTGILFKRGFTSNGLNIGLVEENLGSRGSYIYAGLTTTISAGIGTADTTITFTNANGLNRGDYIQLNSEVIRLASVPSGNVFTVLRSQLGTYRTTAASGSVIKKIKVLPVELRRPSFIRASGHTFEYLGYGPGNYSTTLPQKQNRILDEDEVKNAQVRKTSGGLVAYSGLNDQGEYYTGAKKTVSSTGEDKIIEGPIVTYTGDDAQSILSNYSTASYDEVLVKQRLTVEGGDNNTQTSLFYGPVNFSKKLTSTSTDGIQTVNLLLSGSTSQPKLLTADNTTPTTSSLSIGSISFVGIPTTYIGNTYIKNAANTGNEWRPFGPISRKTGSLSFNLDQIGVGVDINNYNSSYAFVAAPGTLTLVGDLEVAGNVTFDQLQTLGNVQFGNLNVTENLNVTGITTTSSLLVGSATSTGTVSQALQVGNSGSIKGAYISGNLGIGSTNPTQKLDVNGNINLVSSGNYIQKTFADNTEEYILKGPTLSSYYPTISYTRSTGTSTRGFKFGTNDNVGNRNDWMTIWNGAVGIASTLPTATLDVNGTAKVKGDLTVSNGDLYITRTDTATGDIIANGGTDGIFVIYNNTNNGRIQIAPKSSGGITNNILDLTSSTATVNGNLGIGITNPDRTITAYTSTTGKATLGSNVRITNAGGGDAVVSWDNSNNGGTYQRWYAGFDSQDGYAWKLANPYPISTPYGNEAFATVNNAVPSQNETKLKVDTSGNVSILGSLLGSLGNLSIGSVNYTTTINGQLALTQANNVSTGAGQIYLNGGNGNRIDFNQNGVAAPAFTTRSLGTKIVLYPSLGSAGVDYGFGIDTATLWSSVNDSGSQFKWYAGTTNIATLSGAGALTINSIIKSNSAGKTLSTAGGGLNQGYTNANSSGGSYNFLRTNGDDSPLLDKDIINALGYIPANPGQTGSANPKGNSAILDSITGNGTTGPYTLKISGSTYTVPSANPANLVVSVDGIVQKPGTDYSVTDNGTTITFTDVLASTSTVFIIALGGQGNIVNDINWTAKGQLIVGVSAANAAILPVGSNGSILTANSSASPSGVNWSNNIGISGYIDCVTPSATQTTGGVRIRANGTSGTAYLQFTNNAGSSEYANVSATETGGVTFSSKITASSFVKSGGSSSGFLKADGSVDSNTYLTSAPSTSPGGNNNAVQYKSGSSFAGSDNLTFDGTDLFCKGDITAYSSSDQRLKDNITPIPNALDKVLSISGNTFDWNEKSGKEGSDVGVIAQEILEVIPEVVTTRDNGYLAVRYEKLVPLLIEAIKELKEEIKELKGGK